MKKAFLLVLPLFFIVSCANGLFGHKEVFHTVNLTTKWGVIKIKLYNETPLHRDNMLKLVNKGFYDSLLFHRVIKGFMIQGGDPDSKHAPAGKMLGNGDVGYTVPAEFRPDLFHKKGVLAAARDNNPAKASSGCQFYIVEGKTYTDAELDQLESKMNRKITPEERAAYKTIGGTPHLDQNYTVYVEVIEGLNIVDSIEAVKTDRSDRPLMDVRIISMKEGKPLKVKVKK